MENIHKPRNFAAIIRSCDAVGIHTAHAVTHTGDISYHHHTSSGAQKWVDIRCYKDTHQPLELLKNQGYQILAADIGNHCRHYRDVDYMQPTAIIIGSELNGLSSAAHDLTDYHITIPMQGLVASLNVSVATALILFEAQAQRLSTGQYDKQQLDQACFENTLFEWCYPDIANSYKCENKPYPKLDENGFLIN